MLYQESFGKLLSRGVADVIYVFKSTFWLLCEVWEQSNNLGIPGIVLIERWEPEAGATMITLNHIERYWAKNRLRSRGSKQVRGGRDAV